MKNSFCSIFLSLLIIGLPTSVNSQGMFSDPTRYPTSSMNDSFIKANRIAQVVMDQTYLYKHGKPYIGRQLYLYDHEGKSTFVAYFKDTNNPSKMLSFAFYNKGTDLGNKSVSIHRQYKSTLIALPYFDAKGRLIKTQHFRQNGKHAFTYEMFYQDSDLVRYNYLDKNHKLKYYYIYTYEKGKKTSSARYNGKGILLQYFDFNCDDEGTLVTNKKDSGKICTHKTYLSDGTIVTTITYFENGKTPVKLIYHNDSLGNQIKYQYFTGKNLILTYQSSAKYIGTQKIESYFWYGNSKGSPYYSGRTLMDINGQIKEEVDSWFSSPKKYDAYKYEYSYDSKGLLVESKGYLKGRLSVVRRYKFSYYKD